MGDAHAEHAPEGLVDPAVAWGTLGAHVVTARGARRACGGGGVSVRSLRFIKNRGSLQKKSAVLATIGDMLSVQHGTHGDGQTPRASKDISRKMVGSPQNRMPVASDASLKCHAHAPMLCSHAPMLPTRKDARLVVVGGSACPSGSTRDSLV
jgi:hypothetical protein